MAPRQPITNEQRRLLRIAARMPLASVANLAPILGMSEDRVRRMLSTLRGGGWIESVVRGMTERRQHRWFLTRKAVDALYVTDHQAPQPQGGSPRRKGWPSSIPEGELPADYRERFVLEPRPSAVHLEEPGQTLHSPAESPIGHESGR